MNKVTQHPCQTILEALARDGLYEASSDQDLDGGSAKYAGGKEWRITCRPYLLSPEELTLLSELGTHLLAFNQSLNQLYFESLRGRQPHWVAELLDQGKPESLVSFSRMKRQRDHLPRVIRPDIIPTSNGFVITELDSIPGGIGLTGSMAQAYDDGLPNDLALIGGRNGMVEGFAAMLQELKGSRTGCLVIVVSEESKEYLPEMKWVTAQLRRQDLDAFCAEPRDIRFTEEGLVFTGEGGPSPIAVLYRFYELFDLKNIPKTELTLYSMKKDCVAVTPPFKPYLEEKMAFALFHHPILEPFWRQSLGEPIFKHLSGLFPRTWVLDPRPIPPSATIPRLQIGGRAVADWRDLSQASQRDRRFVVKPSGFSELAWGSRGVSIGHDLSQPEWATVLERALNSFATTPYVLQEFHKGRQVTMSFFDPQAEEMVPMPGRVRLSPYYFVYQGTARLAGVLATVCPLDKKVIHGMRDAIMAPCARLLTPTQSSRLAQGS